VARKKGKREMKAGKREGTLLEIKRDDPGRRNDEVAY